VCLPYGPGFKNHQIPTSAYRTFFFDHMIALVVMRIQELAIEVMHVPGGCTSLCQPVDVGFNKPFKDRVRRQWMSWMISMVCSLQRSGRWQRRGMILKAIFN
jgi:hypothetical protein